MFDLERKRNDDMLRSEALPHFKSEEDTLAEKSPENYVPHRSEKDEQTRPREMLSMRNSYGNVAISANRNQELTISISEDRRHNSYSLENDHKKLNGERRKSSRSDIGYTFTNSFDPINSAFAFKTRKMQSERQLFDRIKRYVDDKGQHTVENMLPFFALNQDKRKLKQLNEECRSAKEAREESHEMEHEAELLSRAISLKEEMQNRFIHKMRLAITKASVLTDESQFQPLNSFDFTGGSEIESPPEDDEELPGASLSDKDQSSK